MNERTASLLIELVKLLRKFGPDEFERLAALVGSPEFTASLVQLLQVTAKAGKGAHVERVHAKLKPRAQGVLEKLRETEPEKFTVLSQFKQRLDEKQSLPRLSDVLAFTRDRKLVLPPARSRDKAIEALLRSLADLSVREMQDAIETLPANSGSSDLQGWSEIIMDRAPRKR